MQASLEKTSDDELKQHAAWLLHRLVEVQLLIAKRESEKRSKKSNSPAL